MYAPHTVTLYNVIQETDLESFEDVERVYITFLRGVFLDAVKAVNVRVSGQESADAVSLFIPFDVEAVDATTGEPKEYAAPQDFWRADDAERQGLWTLSYEGHGGETFFVRGEVVEPPDVARAMDDAYNVTKVDLKDFGTPRMRHWEVGGV